jgi:hypothetical protein
MKIPRLILCPKDSSIKPEKISVIKQALKDIDLVAEEFSNAKYYTGTAFLSLVSFLGCAPNINLSPKDGDNYCYIEIQNSISEAKILGHTLSVIPRCPNCKHKFIDWQSISKFSFAKTSINCPECNVLLKMSDLKWRLEGGYGLFHIAIIHIHPHEAVPSEKLLQTLEQATGFAWHYFYANNPIENNT